MTKSKKPFPLLISPKFKHSNYYFIYSYKMFLCISLSHLQVSFAESSFLFKESEERIVPPKESLHLISIGTFFTAYGIRNRKLCSLLLYSIVLKWTKMRKKKFLGRLLKLLIFYLILGNVGPEILNHVVKEHQDPCFAWWCLWGFWLQGPLAHWHGDGWSSSGNLGTCWKGKSNLCAEQSIKVDDFW